MGTVFDPIRRGGDTARLHYIRRLDNVPPSLVHVGGEPRRRGGELLRLAPLLPASRVLHPHPLSHVALLQPSAGKIGLGQRRSPAPPRDVTRPAVHDKTPRRQYHRPDAVPHHPALGTLLEARAVLQIASVRLVEWVGGGQAMKARIRLQGARAL